MLEFSFSRIADFPVPDFEQINTIGPVIDLEASRRRELLFSDEEKSSLGWMAKAAEYFCDIGSYAE